jgi:hypothetical protein
MAQFQNVIITGKGQALMAKMMAGVGNIQFTKINTSSQIYTEEQLEALTALANVKQTTLVSKVTRTNGTAIKIEGAINNASLVAGYSCQTVGVYAIDPEEGEILYGVTGVNGQADYIPAFNGVTSTGIKFELIISVGNASSVTLEVDPAAVATVGDLDEIYSQISDIQSYVGYTEANIYGLEADFQNRTFKRLAGALNKTPGAMFDGIECFGGRKRCNVTDTGVIVAWYGDSAYTETGKLTQAVTKDGTTYAIGTIVQVMVYQPKFYYKVVPLTLEKIAIKEVDTISVTGAATSAGTVTVTLAGTAFNVAVAAGDSVEAVATKIRAAIYAGWITGGTGANVTFTANEAGTKATAIFSGGSTGVTATVTKTTTGSIGKGFHMRKARYYVSMTQKAGFKVHPAFIKNGAEKNYVLIGAYEGCLWDSSASVYITNDAQIADFTISTGDKLSSIANAKPISGLTQDLTRRKCGILAENRGAGWSQEYGAISAATQLLMIVEYGGFNVQNLIGRGNVDNTDDGSTNMSILTGGTSALGNASGNAPGDVGKCSVSYRGEENPWGNIWKFVDGLNIYPYSVHEVYVADNAFEESKTDGTYKNAGITLAKQYGYISAMAYNEPFDWLFFPSETLGDSNLPVGDHFWQNNGYAGGFLDALLGADWSDGSRAGGFCWIVDHAVGGRSRDVGGRLVYVP